MAMIITFKDEDKLNFYLLCLSIRIEHNNIIINIIIEIEFLPS